MKSIFSESFFQRLSCPKTPGTSESHLALISTNDSTLYCGPTDAETLLSEPLDNKKTMRFCVIASGKNRFILWVISVPPETATLPFDDTVILVRNYFNESQSGPLVLMFQGPDSESTDEPQKSAYLVSATKIDSISEDPASFQSIYEKTKASYFKGGNATQSPQRKACISLAFFAAAALLVLATLKLLGRPDPVWIRYNTSGSIGPKRQLQFDHHNVTTWASQHEGEDDKWQLRIDDQAIVPAELWDDEEEHYQEWFRKTFPESEQVRRQRLYISKDFLGDPYAVQIPSDKRFHTAHCVLALRRYWKARESGRHVCPRDIDYKHMKHCLDSLDELAFPDLKSSRGHSHGDDADGKLVLLWKTKICW